MQAEEDIVSHIDDQWQAGLIDTQRFEAHNDVVNYILSFINVFSKYSLVVPICHKTGEMSHSPLGSFFFVLKKMHADKGIEFVEKLTP